MGDETEGRGVFLTIFDGIIWFFQNLAIGFYDLLWAIFHPAYWLDWITWNNTAEDKLSLMHVVYYGGSVEFFFAVLALLLIVTGIGLWRNAFMWGCVRVLEGVANGVGRFAAWAGLLMVIQQIIIVFMQRIFTRPDISIGFGIPLQFDISWFAEELKLYNAIVVCLCVTYTFVQGGHVRVDLIYSAVSHRTKRIIDMVGSVLFMAPSAILIWMYGWYFLWRHLVTPKPAASWTLERAERSAQAVRWNVETIGFSPNGFNGYFLFKILLVAFAGLVFLHAIAFFYRSYLELREGPEAEGKYLDRDTLGEGAAAYAGTH